MPTVNAWHIATILGQLMALDPIEYDRLDAMDSSDKTGMRNIFSSNLVPHYRELRPHGKAKLKESLRYFLNARSEVVGDMIAAMQDVPLSADDPYPAMEALWEALFPGENYQLADVGDYVENNDDATGNEIFAPEGGWPESP